uniref:Late blight resistance protein, putative n=1 Tax=Solanum demissum TaxID=50514 RepID=Q0KIS6_SOLDE|nr:Late blight resistance protein, putative [Solanum demissum]
MESSGSLVCSVLFKNYNRHFACHPFVSRAFAISRILPNFKFLKVLDLEHQVFIDFIPTELFYLRYLSAYIDQNSIPSSISNLLNLETLILKSISAAKHNRVLLPSTVWDMVKLRHLHIPDFSTENEEALLENSAKLYDLETLSTPYFSRVEDAELMLRKTPNLRKLICAVECLDLMEIPSCFMDILSLKYIEVDNCSESVVKSARNIQETQKMVLKFDTSHAKEIRKAFKRLASLPGIQSIAIDKNEKKFTVIGDMDANEAQLVVSKLRKRGQL